MIIYFDNQFFLLSFTKYPWVLIISRTITNLHSQQFSPMSNNKLVGCCITYYDTFGIQVIESFV